MTLSRLEKVAAGLMAIGAVSILGGYIAGNHFYNQIKITAPETRAKELDEKMGKVAQRAHDMSYRRDPKGYDRPVPNFINLENRQTIADAWRDYDKLRKEYDALVSQPGVKESIEKNEKLRNSVRESISIGYSAGLSFAIPGFVSWAIYQTRRKN